MANVVSYQQPAPTAVAQTKPPNNVAAVCSALRTIGTSTTQIADFLQSHPSEVHGASQSAKAIAERLNDLIEATADASESREKLQAAADGAVEAADWISSHFPGGGTQNTAVNNVGAGIPTFNSLQALYASQEQ